MRVTKDFLRDCQRLARQATGSALTIAQKMIVDFISTDKIFEKVIDNVFSEGLNQATCKANDAIQAALAELTTNPLIDVAFTNHLVVKTRKLRDTDFSLHSINPTSIANRLNSTIIPQLFFTLSSGALKTYDLSEVLIPDFNQRIKDHPHVPLAATFYTQYGYNGNHVKPAIDLNSLLTKQENAKFEQLINTATKLTDLIDEIRQGAYIVEQYTTLAQLQENELIWPLIKNHESTSTWITDKKESEIRAKELREEKLKQQREAAAAKRKEQLQELRDNPELNKPKKKYDTSLVNAINTIAKANRNATQGEGNGTQ